MATDVKQILNNLFDFYDFRGKVLISVGAGGGQFVEYGRVAKRVIAIDSDAIALERLQLCLSGKEYRDKFTLIHSDFLEIDAQADVVMFEFSLHEMEQPTEALAHALTLAPDVLIADHSQESEWAFVVDEIEKVERSSAAISKYAIRRKAQFNATQEFSNFDELFTKVQYQGAATLQRIEKYKYSSCITIPMSYGFTLL